MDSTQSWTDPTPLLSAIAAGEGRRVLWLGGAGDNALAAAVMGAHVTVASANEAERALVELKREAARELDLGAYRELLGLGPPGRRIFYYHHVRKRLSPPALAFWDRNEPVLRGGVLDSGVREQAIARHRRRVIEVAHREGTIAAVLDADRGGAEGALRPRLEHAFVACAVEGRRDAIRGRARVPRSVGGAPHDGPDPRQLPAPCVPPRSLRRPRGGPRVLLAAGVRCAPEGRDRRRRRAVRRLRRNRPRGRVAIDRTAALGNARRLVGRTDARGRRRRQDPRSGSLAARRAAPDRNGTLNASVQPTRISRARSPRSRLAGRAAARRGALRTRGTGRAPRDRRERTGRRARSRGTPARPCSGDRRS